MEIYFLRHGLADWPNWNRPDSERPLTDEGVERMKAQAKTMKRLGLAPDLIAASPLVRAQQTAQIVGDRFNLTINVTLLLAPGFDLTKLTAIVRDLPNVKELMVVGHEPDFSQTITSLIGGGRIVMKKGGLARVEILSIEPLAGQLVWLLAPKVLAET
jgi:phosphohistidine phosphatase